MAKDNQDKNDRPPWPQWLFFHPAWTIAAVIIFACAALLHFSPRFTPSQSSTTYTDAAWLGSAPHVVAEKAGNQELPPVVATGDTPSFSEPMPPANLVAADSSSKEQLTVTPSQASPTKQTDSKTDGGRVIDPSGSVVTGDGKGAPSQLTTGDKASMVGSDTAVENPPYDPGYTWTKPEEPVLVYMKPFDEETTAQPVNVESAPVERKSAVDSENTVQAVGGHQEGADRSVANDPVRPNAEITIFPDHSGDSPVAERTGVPVRVKEDADNTEMRTASGELKADNDGKAETAIKYELSSPRPDIFPEEAQSKPTDPQFAIFPDGEPGSTEKIQAGLLEVEQGNAPGNKAVDNSLEVTRQPDSTDAKADTAPVSSEAGLTHESGQLEVKAEPASDFLGGGDDSARSRIEIMPDAITKASEPKANMVVDKSNTIIQPAATVAATTPDMPVVETSSTISALDASLPIEPDTASIGEVAIADTIKPMDVMPVASQLTTQPPQGKPGAKSKSPGFDGKTQKRPSHFTTDPYEREFGKAYE